MRIIYFRKHELKIEPLLRSAGKAYFVLNKTNSGRSFEQVCKKINGAVGRDFNESKHGLYMRRTWSKLKNRDLFALKLLAKQMASDTGSGKRR